jgi:hypothetical protein
MMESRYIFISVSLLGLVVGGLAASGCQVLPDKGISGPASEVVVNGFNVPPRLRYGATPCACIGAPFIGEHLGTHGYYFRTAEKNGIAYTLRGGHIDTMHVRIAADWTAYLAAKSYRRLMRGDRSFSYKLLADRSRHTVHISYPENWQSLSQEQRSETAREVALALGPYLAYSMVSWHEIITWYGFHSVGVIRESHSAFSWEDSYSNLLGAIIAARALRDTEHPYNKAMTIALDEEMRTLGVQPAAVARRASQSVKGKWYTGSIGPLVSMRRRNPDIGIDDGFVTPVLALDPPAGATPVSYPAPTLDGLSKYGFWAFVEIEPHEWERGKIFRIVYPNGHGKRIYPTAHFPAIMDHIRQEAAARYGPDMVYNPLAPTAQNPLAQSNPILTGVPRHPKPEEQRSDQ